MTGETARTGQYRKAIAARRLDVLDEQIAQLHQARAYLAGALLCRYDARSQPV